MIIEIESIFHQVENAYCDRCQACRQLGVVATSAAWADGNGDEKDKEYYLSLVDQYTEEIRVIDRRIGGLNEQLRRILGRAWLEGAS